MPLEFADGEAFATGAARYLYSGSSESEAGELRIAVPVKIEEQRTDAVVDTAADWSVCHPELAGLLQLDPAAALFRITYNIRGNRIKGGVYLLDLHLLAQQGRGSSLQLEAKVFVPDSDPVNLDLAARVLPRSLLGLMGCLELVRFAVDPFGQVFYFGGYPG
jgi:hypothetical protein